MVEQVNFQCDEDDEVLFVLDHHALFVYELPSLTVKTDRNEHVSPSEYIILIPSQSVFARSP